METPDLDGLRKAIQVAGSQTELAKRIGKKQAHVWNWLHRDKKVPAESVLAIERETGVSRHDLRPDIFGPSPASAAA